MLPPGSIRPFICLPTLLHPPRYFLQARENLELAKSRIKEAEKRIDADLDAYIAKAYWTEGRNELRRQVNDQQLNFGRSRVFARCWCGVSVASAAALTHAACHAGLSRKRWIAGCHAPGCRPAATACQLASSHLAHPPTPPMPPSPPLPSPLPAGGHPAL